MKPPKITTLLAELTTEVAYRWEDIGIFLQLNPGILKTIKSDHPNDSKACLRETLMEWLKQQVDPAPSWLDIIDALDKIGHHPLAWQLRRKYAEYSGVVNPVYGVVTNPIYESVN